MKIYFETETLTAENTTERRPKQLVLETGASMDEAKAALFTISEGLGKITAVPAAAHEANLKQILPRDLAAKGVTPGTGTEGEIILKIHREPGEGDMIALRYNIATRG